MLKAAMLEAVVLGLLLLFTLPLASPASACSCLPPPPPGEALQQAEAVFLGEVVGNRLVEDPGGASGRQVTFRLLRRWKGPETAEVVVATPRDEAGCGVWFEPGEAYLVYAHPSEGHLQTTLCTRTAAATAAEADLAALGEGRPVSQAEESPKGGTCGGTTNAAAAQAVLFVGLGLALRRRFVSFP